MHSIATRLLKACNLTIDLYKTIDDEGLKLRISDLPSNTIGEQVYCIVGARESYLIALKHGKWKGFSCSLEDCFDQQLVIHKLEESSSKLEQFLQEADINNINADLLIDLLEHEVMHHGQLIRYFYANRLSFPKSWNQRYTV
ncbi:hypothetical protein E3U55_03545 [Filobacillus milosensis]|uniref:DinB family protein n=1 Tax=Filobacillus milosensis TaxID=94137 RepID=A0A4Y8IUM1_9BACI|nr:hypothetical protein [Filobacillus milosensis]TFB23899.1 hypothetical protein E3U55_03545 [Filobacillus milosensis]